MDIKAKNCGIGGCYWIIQWFRLKTKVFWISVICLPCQIAWATGWGSPYQTSWWGWHGKQEWDTLGTKQLPNVSGSKCHNDKESVTQLLINTNEKRYMITSNQIGNQRWTCQFLTVTQVGMRSHLFRTKIRCFQGFSFFKYASMLLERVPMGSRASSTWMMTSDESITYYNKIVRSVEWPHNTSVY